jgi:hypothetical protein
MIYLETAPNTVPELKFLELLPTRNGDLIQSHHPLRETFIDQAGKSYKDRTGFHQKIGPFAISTLIYRWETKSENEFEL